MNANLNRNKDEQFQHGEPGSVPSVKKRESCKTSAKPPPPLRRRRLLLLRPPLARHTFPHGRSIIRRRSGASLPNPLLFGAQGVRYKKLEVILTSPIHKLGKPGDTVKVKPGFFRNHLMPKFLAVPNIDKFAFLVKEQREAYEPKEVEEVKVARPKTEEDKMREYQAAARRLDSSTLVLRKFTLSEEEVRDPVTKDEIVAEVARQLSVHIEPQNLYLPTPLTSFGEFEVPLRLPRSIPLPDGKLQWGLNVKIRRK